MEKLMNMVEFISGSPQFRIVENLFEEAPLYTFYSQTDLSDDLVGLVMNDADNKQIRTFDKVNTLSEGDVVFSLISGTASLVRDTHIGYLYTQNYVKLVPKENIDPKYLVYLLNCEKKIKKQFMVGLQGSQVLKYTLKQVKELEIPALPSMERQKIIGDIYIKRLRSEALCIRAAESQTTIILKQLEEASSNE